MVRWTETKKSIYRTVLYEAGKDSGEMNISFHVDPIVYRMYNTLMTTFSSEHWQVAASEYWPQLLVEPTFLKTERLCRRPIILHRRSQSFCMVVEFIDP